jgi:hypothetical protein
MKAELKRWFFNSASQINSTAWKLYVGNHSNVSRRTPLAVQPDQNLPDDVSFSQLDTEIDRNKSRSQYFTILLHSTSRQQGSEKILGYYMVPSPSGVGFTEQELREKWELEQKVKELEENQQPGTLERTLNSVLERVPWEMVLARFLAGPGAVGQAVGQSTTDTGRAENVALAIVAAMREKGLTEERIIDLLARAAEQIEKITQENQENATDT